MLKLIIVVVLVFNVPPTAKVIWRRGNGLSLIRQTGEAGNRTFDPWLIKLIKGDTKSPVNFTLKRPKYLNRSN